MYPQLSVDWYPWLTLNGNLIDIRLIFEQHWGWQSVESQLIFADMHAIVYQTDQCISVSWQSTDYRPTVYGVLIRCNRGVVQVSSDCWLSVDQDFGWGSIKVMNGHLAMDAFSSHDQIIVPCSIKT